MKPRYPDQDPDQNAVHVQDIKNLWIEALREFETVLCPIGFPDRDQLIKFLDSLQYKLYARARRPGSMPVKVDVPEGDSRDAYQKRLAELKLMR